jgi:hypothetical protein
VIAEGICKEIPDTENGRKEDLMCVGNFASQIMRSKQSGRTEPKSFASLERIDRG